MTELLSVVVPTHDRPERLREAVRSVLSQDYRSIELVVVDDGSGSSTARTLDELTAKDRRIVVVRHDHPLGSAAARNTGLALARGELVAFCDDDDVWLPGAASAAVSASKPSTGVVYGWHQVLQEATGRCVTFRPPATCGPSIMRWINVPSILSGVARRSVLGDALRFDASLYTSEDWDLWLRCSDMHPSFWCPLPCIDMSNMVGNGSPGVLSVMTRALSVSSISIDPRCRQPVSPTTNSRSPWPSRTGKPTGVS